MNTDCPKIYLYKRIVQAKLFIDHNYAYHIDLNNISDEAYFSKFHFIRLFKQVYGMTPHKYLSRVRVEKAKLLLEKDMPILEICHAIGFESASSFTGFFKRTVGVTPSTFQLHHLKRNTEMAIVPLKYVPNCFATKIVS